MTWLLITLLHGTVMAIGPFTHDECAAELDQKYEVGVCLPRDHPLITPPDISLFDNVTDDVQVRRI